MPMRRAGLGDAVMPDEGLPYGRRPQQLNWVPLRYHLRLDASSLIAMLVLKSSQTANTIGIATMAKKIQSNVIDPSA